MGRNLVQSVPVAHVKSSKSEVQTDRVIVNVAEWRCCLFSGYEIKIIVIQYFFTHHTWWNRGKEWRRLEETQRNFQKLQCDLLANQRRGSWSCCWIFLAPQYLLKNTAWSELKVRKLFSSIRKRNTHLIKNVLKNKILVVIGCSQLNILKDKVKSGNLKNLILFLLSEEIERIMSAVGSTAPLTQRVCNLRCLRMLQIAYTNRRLPTAWWQLSAQNLGFLGMLPAL